MNTSATGRPRRRSTLPSRSQVPGVPAAVLNRLSSLRSLAQLYLSEEEKAKIEKMGWDELMETLKKRFEEQKKRHEGGNKMIGTAGTSPFGAYGYNPQGIRVGQDKGRNKSAVKVWDQRQFKDYDDSLELGTRNIKVALRRLRRFAREGSEEELDLDDTGVASTLPRPVHQQDEVQQVPYRPGQFRDDDLPTALDEINHLFRDRHDARRQDPRDLAAGDHRALDRDRELALGSGRRARVAPQPGVLVSRRRRAARSSTARSSRSRAATRRRATRTRAFASPPPE